MNKVLNNINDKELSDILNIEKNNMMNKDKNCEQYLDLFLLHILKYKIQVTKNNNGMNILQSDNILNIIRASSYIFYDRGLLNNLKIDEVQKFKEVGKNSDLFLIYCNSLLYFYVYSKSKINVLDIYNYLLSKIDVHEELLSKDFIIKRDDSSVIEIFNNLNFNYNKREIKFINKINNFNELSIIKIGKVLSLSKIIIDDIKYQFKLETKDNLENNYEDIVDEIKSDYGCFETFTHFSIMLIEDSFKNTFINNKITKYRKSILKDTL